MIEMHVINELMHPVYRRAPWFGLLDFVNGQAAPSFLFISGFAFFSPVNAIVPGSEAGALPSGIPWGESVCCGCLALCFASPIAHFTPGNSLPPPSRYDNSSVLISSSYRLLPLARCWHCGKKKYHRASSSLLAASLVDGTILFLVV